METRLLLRQLTVCPWSLTNSLGLERSALGTSCCRLAGGCCTTLPSVQLSGCRSRWRRFPLAKQGSARALPASALLPSQPPDCPGAIELAPEGCSSPKRRRGSGAASVDRRAFCVCFLTSAVSTVLQKRWKHPDQAQRAKGTIFLSLVRFSLVSCSPLTP